MNGDKNFIIDTNILILYFDGKLSLNEIFESANLICISIISYLEFLGYSKLNKSDIRKFEAFVNLIQVLELPSFKENSDFYNLIIQLRREKLIKLADCLIVCQAVTNNYTLVTNDKQLHTVKNLETLSI